MDERLARGVIAPSLPPLDEARVGEFVQRHGPWAAVEVHARVTIDRPLAGVRARRVTRHAAAPAPLADRLGDLAGGRGSAAGSAADTGAEPVPGHTRSYVYQTSRHTRDSPTVAIVGAGASGTLLARPPAAQRRRARAADRARRPRRPRRGLRHALRGPPPQRPRREHERPARRPRAFPALRTPALDAATEPTTFVPRRVYGEYLEALLAESRGLPRPAPRSCAGRARSSTSRPRRGRALAADVRRRLARARRPRRAGARQPAPARSRARRGRLARGSRALHPRPLARGCARGPRARPRAARRHRPDDGGHRAAAAGARSPGRRSSRSRAAACSPTPIAPAAPRRARVCRFPTPTPSLLALLRFVRSAAVVAELGGGDWRDAVNALRPVTAELWAALPHDEQRRFVDRLARFWDIHRHRLAPQVATAVDELRAQRPPDVRERADPRRGATRRRPRGDGRRARERADAHAARRLRRQLHRPDRQRARGRLASARGAVRGRHGAPASARTRPRHLQRRRACATRAAASRRRSSRSGRCAAASCGSRRRCPRSARRRWRWPSDSRAQRCARRL